MDGTAQATPGPAAAANAASSGATPAGASAAQPGEMASATSPVTIWNVGLLIIGLCVAIAITSEIVTRKEDFARVEGYHKWLVTCSAGATDKDCKKFEGTAAWKLADEIEVTATQVRRYHSFNAFGAPDRCHIPAVFASQIGHFWEDCETILRWKAIGREESLREAVAKAEKEQETDKLHKPQNKILLETIVRAGWLGSWSRLDEWAKEPLYFALVLVSALIGSLIAGLRTASFTTHRDVALGLGAGFAVYILLRGGNFVFFTGSASIDILNPFTAAAVGLLVGLFNDKAFGLLGNAMPTTLSAPGQQAAGNQGASSGTAQPTAAMKNAALAQTNALAAATKTHEAILEAMKKALPDSDAFKALQPMAAAALEAKTKAEEAAKAQGEAARTK